MAFNLFLNFDDKGAEKKIAGIQGGLDKAVKSTDQARDAMGKFTSSAGAAGAAGAKAGEDTAKGMDKAKAAAEGHGDSLTKLIHLAEAYIAIHQVESIVDGYVEIRNKTNSVSTSAGNLNAVMNEQFRIAQETRSSWEDLASTYQRISNAGRGLGLSQRQILDLTEELAMGMRLSGSSSREAAMTMMELTHAFTVGALTGREFKVMMKDAPALMHELQVVSGVAGNEFAEMGKKGKFSAQNLIEWFDKAKGTIADKFAATIPTISEGFTLIRNAAQKFFGEAGLGTGVIQGLGQAMRVLADHFEAVGKVVLAVVEVLLALFVIEKIIVLVKALTLAIAANPLGAILTALTVGIALLRQFGDELNTNQKIWSNVEGQFVTVGDQLFAVWQMIKKLGAAVIEFVEVAWHSLTDAFDNGVNSDGIELSMRNVLLFIASFVDSAIGIFKFLNDTIVTIFGGIPAVITQAFYDLARGALSVVTTLVNTIIDGVNKVIGAYEKVRTLLPGSNGKTPDEDAEQQQRIAQKWAASMNAKYNLNISPVGATQEEQARRDAGMRAAIAAGYTPTAAGFVPGQAPGGYPHEGAIGHIDLDFKNPLEGASESFLKKFGEDWKSDINGTNVTKDMVSSFMDDVDRIARDHAAKRVSEANLAKGEIGTVGNTPDAKIPDEKAAKAAEKAFEKLAGQLRTVTEASNPQSEAIEKLSHAHEILEKAVAAVNPKTREHLLTAAEATRIYDNYRAKLEDAIHPFDAWIRKQGEASAALRDTSEEQERAAKLQTFVNELRQKTGGVGATAIELTLAEKQIALDQKHAEQMRAEQGFTAAILGPQRTYQIQLAALGDLLERNRITSDQYGRAVDGVRAAYLAADPAILTTQQRIEAAWLKAKADALAAGVAVKSYVEIVDEVRAQQLAAGPEGKTFAGGLESAWLKAKADARGYGEILANQLVGDVDKLNEALVSMANGGKVAWSQMIDAMIQDLERLIVKQLEVAAINAIITAATGAPVPGVGQAVVGSGALPDPGIPRVAPASSLPAAYPAPPASTVFASSSAPQPIVLEVHNHLDDSVVHSAMDSREGRRIVINHIRAEPGAVMAYSGTRR